MATEAAARPDGQPGDVRRRPWEPLQSRNYRFFAACDVISALGSAVSFIALPFAVLPHRWVGHGRRARSHSRDGAVRCLSAAWWCHRRSTAASAGHGCGYRRSGHSAGRRPQDLLSQGWLRCGS
jgi:hypothetical protein